MIFYVNIKFSLFYRIFFTKTNKLIHKTKNTSLLVFLSTFEIEQTTRIVEKRENNQTVIGTKRALELTEKKNNKGRSTGEKSEKR